MTPTPIAYLAPLEAGWARMKKLLFGPFDLSRWMIIGFTAWLAMLGEGGGASAVNVPDSSNHQGGGGDFIGEHLALIIVLAVLVLLLALAVGLVVTWVSSRGKFMFLENLATGVARVAEPWRRWKKQGNSLFLWSVGFGFVMLGAVMLVAGLGFALAWPDLQAHVFHVRALLGVVLGGLLLTLIVIPACCISVFLVDFVVVLMRRHEITTTAAWGIFLRLFRARPGPFILYLLLRLAFGMVVGMALVLAGFLTCCCGFIILAIPYIGTVVMLPILAWERYWSIEFLRQFGPEYDLDAVAVPPSLPAAPAGA